MFKIISKLPGEIYGEIKVFSAINISESSSDLFGEEFEMRIIGIDNENKNTDSVERRCLSNNGHD
jgi:hypothetical protein